VEPVVHRRNTSTRGLSQPKPSNVLARRILGGGPNTQGEWDWDYSYQSSEGGVPASRPSETNRRGAGVATNPWNLMSAGSVEPDLVAG
jgi:hypothetical protein